MFFGLSLLGSVKAIDDDRYKEERPTVFYNAGMFFKDRDNPEAGLSDKGKEFLISVMDSEKFNVILIDPEVSYNAIIPISLNGSPFNDVIQKELASHPKVQNIMPYENLKWQNLQKLKEVTSSPNSLIKNSNYYDIDKVFYELVDLYHNPSEEGFSKGGADPLKKDPDLLELLFKLGGDAFAEDFDLNSLKPVVSFKTIPPTCVVSTVTLVLKTCLKHLTTEYKWIKESTKECGVFEEGTNRPLQKVHSFLCEPKYIMDFEQYVQEKIISPCEGSFSCLESFLNEEAGELVDFFHEILLKEKVTNLRKKVYSDEDFAYTAEVDNIASELNDFRFLCDSKLQEKYLDGYFKNHPESLTLYNQANDLTTRSLSKGLSEFLSDDQITEVIDSGQVGLNKCLRDELEHHYKNNLFGINGLENSFENYLNFCQRNRFFEALSKLGGELTENEDLLRRILGSLNGACPDQKVNFNDRDLRNSIHSFNFEYDANRCFSELSRKVNEGELIDSEPILTEFMTLNGGMDATYKKLGKKYYDKCMKEGGSNQTECLEEGIKKGKAEILYNSLIDSGVNSKNESLDIERSESAMNLFVSRAVGDSGIWDCFEKSSERGRSAQECRVLAFRHLEPQKYEQRRGQTIVPKMEIATAALHDDLAGMVTELDREISVFHWGENGILNGFSEDEPAALNSTRANNYLRLRSSMFHTGPFWDMLVPGSDNGTNAGRGLYAAVDPNSTNHFGDTLFEIRLPEGSRYLDLREKYSQGSIPLSHDTVKKLEEAGCDLYTKSGFSRESEYVKMNYGKRVQIDKAAFEKEGKCHQIFSKVIADLNVNFLSYGYDMVLPSFCDQAKQRGAAFVMIDIDISGQTTQYNRLTIEEAIKANKDNGTPIPEEIKRIMQVAQHPFSGHEEVNPDTSDTEIINYWKERIFLCDGLKSEVLGQ